MDEISESFLGTHKIKLLEGFTDEEVNEFLSFGIPMEFQVHDTIITENQFDTFIYIVVDGRVSIWRKNIPLLDAKKGESFNTTTILLQRPTTISVIAEATTRIIKIKRSEVLKFFSMKPERLFKRFTLNMITILLKKVEVYEERMMDYYLELHHAKDA